jgi:uncharacterized protein (TIGR02145 family)
MAENLDYWDNKTVSYCFNDYLSSCNIYGRLYTWGAAMDSAGTWSKNGKGCGGNRTCSPTYPVRGICPSGWHLPDTTEFKTLLIMVGGGTKEGWDKEGIVLKSTDGWYDDFSEKGRNGMDSYSFSALPAGERGDDGYYYGENYRANFWCSSEFDYYYACGMLMRYDINVVNLYGIYKGGGYSVRCVKD